MSLRSAGHPRSSSGWPPFKDELPYVVAMIALEEGVRVECEPGLGVPFWRPVPS
jgi:hypothetical protein